MNRILLLFLIHAIIITNTNGQSPRELERNDRAANRAAEMEQRELERLGQRTSQMEQRAASRLAEREAELERRRLENYQRLNSLWGITTQPPVTTIAPTTTKSSTTVTTKAPDITTTPESLATTTPVTSTTTLIPTTTSAPFIIPDFKNGTDIRSPYLLNDEEIFSEWTSFFHSSNTITVLSSSFMI